MSHVAMINIKKWPTIFKHSSPLLSAVSWWALAISVLVVFLQALHPAWRFHAVVDPYFVFYDRVHYFFTHGNLTNLPFNEYQPGAIFYFVSLAPVLWLSQSRDAFVLAFMLSNVALIVAYGWLLKKHLGAVSMIVLALIVLAAGPITLLRFEVFCQWWISISFLLWQKGKYPLLGGWTLAVATMTKVYPVFFLPLLALAVPAHLKKISRWRWAGQWGLGFGLGLASVTVAYMAFFQVSFSQVFANAEVHAHKPVHFESVIGSAEMLRTYLFEGRAPEPYANLIHGIALSEFGAVGPYLNYFCLLPIGLAYLLVLRRPRWQLSSLVSLAVAMIATFLASSTQLGPQYFLWFALLVPLLAWPKETQLQTAMVWLVGWLVADLWLTQWVFPLWYTELLSFFKTGVWSVPLTVFMMRNAVLLIFVGYSWRWYRLQKKE